MLPRGRRTLSGYIIHVCLRFVKRRGEKRGDGGLRRGVPGAPGLNRLRHLQTLPLWYPAGGAGGWSPACPAAVVPAGGLPALPSAYPAFGLPFCPLSPQPPSPAGKGETYSFLMQGASPLASPALDRLRHLQNLPSRYPAEGLPRRHWLSLPSTFPAGGLAGFAARLPCRWFDFLPHPPNPLPSGKGENQSFLMQGASPLASPALDRLRHLQNLPSRYPVGAYPAGCRFGGR